MPLDRAITRVNDETLSELVLSARQRVIAVAPAFSKIVAEAIAEQWARLSAGGVSVILDSDADVYRLGYGHLDGLKKLQEAAISAGATLLQQPGIRIGLIVSDDETLVFSPTPQLIESTGENREAPNAIRFGPPPAQVAIELGQGPGGPKDRVIGTTVLNKDSVAAIADDLQKNPPQKFDLARKLRVFNSYLEFVELEIKGTQIQKKTVKLPNYIFGVTDKVTRERLEASFRILPPDGDNPSGGLDLRRAALTKKYLKVIPNFGTVILRTQKRAFEADLETLKKEVETFRQKVSDWLQQQMDTNRKQLFESSFERLRQNPPKEWYSLGEKPDDELIRMRLETDLEHAMGSAKELVGEISAHCLFKGVTHEMLNDPQFIKLLEKKIPELDKRFFEEFEAAKALTTDSV